MQDTGMTRVMIRIKGKLPLLMCSQEGVNPRHPLTKEMKAINAKRTKKTDDDLIRLADIEMHLHLYHKEGVGPFMPALNVKRCIEDGAKTSNKGKTTREALELICDTDRHPIDMFPLWYGDGAPRELEEIINSDEYRDTRSARVQMATVMRVRPIFHVWGLDGFYDLDEQIIGFDDFARFCYEAGRRKGLGDYRPEFGKFEVQVFKGNGNTDKDGNTINVDEAADGAMKWLEAKDVRWQEEQRKRGSLG